MPPKKTTSTTSKLSFQSSKSSTKPKTKTELKAEEVLREQEALRVENSREKGIVLDTIEFKDAYKIGKREMGVPTLPLDQVDVILKWFDNTADYGPVVGLTRLERYERSVRLGLDPPEAVKSILMTPEGQSQSRYRDPCFAGL